MTRRGRQLCDGCGLNISPLKQESKLIIKQTRSGRDKRSLVKVWLCRRCRKDEQ